MKFEVEGEGEGEDVTVADAGRENYDGDDVSHSQTDDIETPMPALDPPETEPIGSNTRSKGLTQTQVQAQKGTALYRELSKLNSSYNPTLHLLLTMPQQIMMITATFNDTGDPATYLPIYLSTYQDAMLLSNNKEWWSAMCKEFNAMEQRMVFELIVKKYKPQN